MKCNEFQFDNKISGIKRFSMQNLNYSYWMNHSIKVKLQFANESLWTTKLLPSNESDERTKLNLLSELYRSIKPNTKKWIDKMDITYSSWMSQDIRTISETSKRVMRIKNFYEWNELLEITKLITLNEPSKYNPNYTVLVNLLGEFILIAPNEKKK